jgi:hypothetical protein
MSIIAASAPIVDWGTLGKVVLYSLGAGAGVALCFSVAVVGATRFVEARRAGSPMPAAVYGTMATVGLLATTAAVVVGIVVMASKK